MVENLISHSIKSVQTDGSGELSSIAFYQEYFYSPTPTTRGGLRFGGDQDPTRMKASGEINDKVRLAPWTQSPHASQPY